jgi:hypothetical protein
MTSENRPAQAREQRPVRTPSKVKWVAAGLSLEAAFFVPGILVLLLEAKSKVDHGQSGADPLILAAAFNLPFVAVLATCAVLATRGASWVWWLAGAPLATPPAGTLRYYVSHMLRFPYYSR